MRAGSELNIGHMASIVGVGHEVGVGCVGREAGVGRVGRVADIGHMGGQVPCAHNAWQTLGHVGHWACDVAVTEPSGRSARGGCCVRCDVMVDDSCWTLDV